MFFDFMLTIPALTTEAAPVTQILKLTAGVIHRMEVSFPKGTRARVHCTLSYHEHQFIPTNPGGSLAWDGHTILVDEYYPLDKAPFEVKFRGWSDADTYAYDLAVRIGVLRKEVLLPSAGIMAAPRRLLNLARGGG